MLHESQRAIDRLHSLYPAPGWVEGATPCRDAEFLLQMVTAHQPATIVELGVAAGVSSAVLLYALDTLPETVSGRLLYSCDVRPWCYFDASYPTGAAAATMYPSPHARWILDTDVDARRLSNTLAPASVDLTFIDANHHHPWPLLDLLHMTVVAKPGSWVMLHDINLPVLKPVFNVWGAKWLFDAWPFEKLAGGEPRYNIGAVKLPDDLTRLGTFAATLLERPWGYAPTLQHVSLPPWFAEVQHLVERQIRRCA